MNEGRIPPYNNEAEIAVLGAVLLENKTLAEILSVIGPEHFYNEVHRRMFNSMVDLSRKGNPVDHVTLGNHLKEAGDLEKIGGAAALAQLTDSVATVANVGHYAKIIREQASVRSMILSAQEVAARGFGGAYEDAQQFLIESRQSVTKAAAGMNIGAGPQHIDEDLKVLIADLEAGKPPEGIVKTGIPNIDWTTGGLWPGLLYICAARPAMGKTAFAVVVATNAAMAGYKVLIITLEDIRKLLVSRLLARFADVDLNDINLRRKIDYEGWKRIMKAVNTLSGKKPIWIEDIAGLTSAAIYQIAAAHKMIHGLDLLVVDHLNEFSDQAENRRLALEGGARTMAHCAKELDIPVLLLHQMNRAVEHRGKDKTPMMADLNESGQLEAIARNIWFLYRPAYYEPDSEDRRDLRLIVAKANHGKTGLVRLWMDLSRMYTRDWNVESDGLFPGDEDRPQAARDSAKNRDDGRQGNFFSGSDAQSNWERGDDKDY